MPGELSEDDPLTSPDADFEVNVHNVILDTVACSIHRRFSANEGTLDPNNFGKIKANGLPSSALQDISKCLLKFDNGIIVYGTRGRTGEHSLFLLQKLCHMCVSHSLTVQPSY